jgi:hypothetical protein
MLTVEDNSDERVHVLYEISGWFCPDCITNGRMHTNVAASLNELEKLLIDYDEAAEDLEIFESMDESEIGDEKESFSDCLALIEGIEFILDTYYEKAESMKKAMLEYDGTPVKMVIKIDGEEYSGFLLNVILNGKDRLFRNMYMQEV